MTKPRLPAIADAQPAWNRRSSEIVNRLLTKTETMQTTLNTAVLKDGADIYIAPTISDPPTKVEVQAIADALAAVSLRLKG